MRTAYLLGLLAIAVLGGSCTSYQDFLNYSQQPSIPDDPMAITNYVPLTIQPNDMLQIRLSSIDMDAIRPFVSASGSGGSGFDQYLVNGEGYIDFPTIGAIYVKGLRLQEVQKKISERLSTYFEQPPIVQLNLANFTVNVNGEVNGPGSFQVNDDRLTIIEAITLAGDFTSYSRRDSILIIRERNGMREFGYVDFNNAELFSSPYFYLQQNDVVYVKPNKNKVNTVRDPATRYLPWVSAGVSIILLITTFIRRN